MKGLILIIRLYQVLTACVWSNLIDSYKTMVYTSVNWTLKKTFDDYTLGVTSVTCEYMF